jgi:phosphoribosylaminoimidazole carboxylase (NCAIR synthetase)
MARFPRSEAEIAALARRMMTGLVDAAEDFPAPPVATEQLQAALTEYDATKDAALAGDAAAARHHAVKDEALEKLVDLMKANLRYAENTVRHDPEKLKQIGWAERKASTSMELPVMLDWKEPRRGGRVAAYKVQCRTGDRRA